MAALRTELADLEKTASVSEQGQDNVARSLRLVSDVQEQLTSQSARAQASLTAIEAQRRDLLAK